MFDTFVTNNSFTCSNCDEVIVMERGIQSKQFESELMSFRTGDMPREMNEDRQVVEDYDWCPKCSGTIPVFFSFHRGIYVETFSSYELAEKASCTFDVIKAYRNLNTERNTFEENFNSMNNDLISVHELHSKHPSKQRMTPFMMLRQTDIVKRTYKIICKINIISIKFTLFL